MNSFRDACCWRLMEYFKSAEFEWGCLFNRRWGVNIVALPKQKRCIILGPKSAITSGSISGTIYIYIYILTVNRYLS
jgi:hypothetical protein